MGDLRAPSVLSELKTLWQLATAAERCEFMSHVTTGPNVQRSRMPADAGPVPVVRLDTEGGR